MTKVYRSDILPVGAIRLLIGDCWGVGRVKKRLVHITEEQDFRLTELAQQDGNSVAAHIRAALDHYLFDPRPEYNPTIRTLVYQRDHYTCCHCGQQGQPGLGSGDLQVHHKVPRSEGGDHSLANLETLCTPCHKQADRRHFLERLRADQVRRGVQNPPDVEALLARGPTTPPRHPVT